MRISLEQTDDGVTFRQFRNNDCIAVVDLPIATVDDLRAAIKAHLNLKDMPDGIAIRHTDKSITIEFFQGPKPVKLGLKFPELLAAIL